MKNINIKKIKGAIFDLDGTVLNSMYIWDEIGIRYLKKLGIEPDLKFKKEFKELSLRQAAEYYRNYFKIDISMEEIINGVNKMVEGFYFDEVLKKDNVENVLELLKSNGTKMCVATATDKYLVEKALERNGILDYFSEIYTCAIVDAGKDEAKIYDVAREHLGTPLENTVIFEDALYAIKTAKDAGYTVIGIEDVSAKEDREEIKKLCDLYVKDHFELYNVLK